MAMPTFPSQVLNHSQDSNVENWAVQDLEFGLIDAV